MKNILLSTALAFILLTGFTSCKKDWSCKCADQNNNTSSTAINNQTLLDARSKCKNMDYNYTIAGTTFSKDCSLQ